MKFTLIFYTRDWEVGPTIELCATPSTGNTIWIKERKSDEEATMFYVDNIMYAERGLNDEDITYLFVRPYTGYGKFAPMTEADRTTKNIGKLSDAVATISEQLSDLSAAPQSDTSDCRPNELYDILENIYDKQLEIIEKQQELIDVVIATDCTTR